MHGRTCVAFALLLAAALLGGCRPAAQTGATTGATTGGDDRVTLSAYIPCGLTVPFHEALAMYEAANPSVAVKPLFDNDATLLKMVRDEGQRPDVFVSPGGREFGVLVEQGLAEEAAAARVGSFKIVAAVRRGWTGRVTRPGDLTGAQVKSIALPDPDNTSLGWHVRQSLTKLGLWAQVQPKVRPAGRIIEAFDQVLQGKADLTFTYRSCPLPKSEKELAKSKARIAFELPLDSYDEPQVTIGVLSTTAHRAEAEALVRFLGSHAAAQQMIASGLPDERAGLAPAQPATGQATWGPVAAPGKAAVVAFFPDDADHKPVRALLASLPQRFPGRVTVEVHNFRDPSGDPQGFQMWQNAGLGCAGILINGKNSFTVGAGKAAHQVRFQRKMDVIWTQQELLDALAQELKGSGAPASAG